MAYLNNIEPAMTQSDSSEAVDKLYQSLWTEAVAAKQANIEFSAALDMLVENVRNDVLPIELELGELLKQVLHKQLGFCKRRALSEQHRNELHYWMEENVHTIKQMGMADEELLEETALAHATFSNIPLDHKSDVSVSDQVDQYYAGLEARAKEDTSSSTHCFLDDHDQSNTSASEYSSADTSTQSDTDFQAYPGDLDINAFDDVVFQKLFRRVANALHPDKESDDQLREEKQRLMSLLLESRKNYDLISLLELHQEYVSDIPAFTLEEKHSLATVLNYFIQQEKNDADTPIMQSGLHVSAYKRFYAPAPEQRTANIKHYVATLTARRENYAYFANDINTVFKLGVMLDKRLEQKDVPTPISSHALTATTAVIQDANNSQYSERYENE